MKLKYRTADGELLMMGYLPDITPGEGEAVIDIEAAIPSPLDGSKYDGGVIRLKTDLEKDQVYWCTRFSTDLAIATINVVYTVTERALLAPYLSIIKDYMNYPAPLRNFSDLKILMAELVSTEKATQEQYDKLKGVLLEQNIDLDIIE